MSGDWGLGCGVWGLRSGLWDRERIERQREIVSLVVFILLFLFVVVEGKGEMGRTRFFCFFILGRGGGDSRRTEE